MRRLNLVLEIILLIFFLNPTHNQPDSNPNPSNEQEIYTTPCVGTSSTHLTTLSPLYLPPTPQTPQNNPLAVHGKILDNTCRGSIQYLNLRCCRGHNL